MEDEAEKTVERLIEEHKKIFGDVPDVFARRSHLVQDLDVAAAAATVAERVSLKIRQPTPEEVAARMGVAGGCDQSPVVELKIGEKAIQLVQKLEFSLTAEEMLPVVTLSFIPKALDVDMDAKAIVNANIFGAFAIDNTRAVPVVKLPEELDDATRTKFRNALSEMLGGAVATAVPEE